MTEEDSTVITLEVNGMPLTANEGETLLKALCAGGVNVPALCHMEGFSPTGACRLCVVEVENQRGLTPSCATIVANGMKVRTHSPRVLRARKTIVELLLAGHPDDCLYCTRSGSCELQTLARQLGVDDRRFTGAKNRFPLDISSPSIVRDPDKCILCGRCVRVCEETQGVGAIDFINRGCATQIGTAFNRGLNTSTCINCGQCLTVCPKKAMSIDWQTEIVPFMERMVEYALGAVAGKAGRVGYFNFLVNVTPDCDCVPWSDAPIVPDIGFLASTDPVALDKACLDLVNEQAACPECKLEHGIHSGEDKFTALWQWTRGDMTFVHGAAVGLGNPEYELVRV